MDAGTTVAAFLTELAVAYRSGCRSRSLDWNSMLWTTWRSGLVAALETLLEDFQWQLNQTHRELV
jgi:hypothetical protein